ncbi:MAG: hypothetical protein DHS20C08_20460 [Rhodomicrobium sp.]|nr:MAG: hypothetical protein DHS20C08_20460 [Rhodomicrobium sp.]
MSSGSTMLKKLAFAAVGQALPDKASLTASLRATQIGLVATVAFGVFVASFLLLGLFGFYLLLRAEGVSQLTSFGLITGLLFMLTIITGLIAERYVSRASEDVTEQMDPMAQVGHLAEPVEQIFSAFLDGILNQGSSALSRKTNGAASYKLYDVDRDVAVSHDAFHRQHSVRRQS